VSKIRCKDVILIYLGEDNIKWAAAGSSLFLCRRIFSLTE
jgi:hypothetical protein